MINQSITDGGRGQVTDRWFKYHHRGYCALRSAPFVIEYRVMPIYQVTPLAPAYLLLLSAALILTIGPALTARRRHWLVVAGSALAVLSLLLVGSYRPYSPGAPPIHVLAEWLGEPALAVRISPFEPFLWILMLSLLAISLAEWDTLDWLSSPFEYPTLSQAMLFVLIATACGVVLAGTYRSVAFTLLVFDGTAALFLLVNRRPGPADFGELSRAVGRLLLGVLSSASVVALAGGMDHPTSYPVELGGLFSLTIWLRLGLYPLVEMDVQEDSMPVPLGWTVTNLSVGLYLASTGVAPWVLWLAGATTALHGALAWLEPGRERALAHVGYTLAGGVLVMAAVVKDRAAVVAASLSILAALSALELTPPRLGRPDWKHPQRLWVYLPPLLATATLAGVPFTLGWEGRGALYRATWEAGAPGPLALVVVAEGAALSVLYPYWRGLFRDAPGEAARVWRPLGAALAAVPFLIPVVGPRLLPIFTPLISGLTPLPTFGPHSLSAALGLIGALLWAFFLGYGRRRLLDTLPFSRAALISALHLGRLLRRLGQTLDLLSRLLLRVHAVIEGAHYLAWAILLALGLGLLIALS